MSRADMNPWLMAEAPSFGTWLRSTGLPAGCFTEHGMKNNFRGASGLMFIPKLPFAESSISYYLLVLEGLYFLIFSGA